MSQYVAFGLHWQSDLPLLRFNHANLPVAEPHVRVTRVGRAGERDLMELHAGAHVQLGPDGFRHTTPETAQIDVFGGDRIEVATGPAWTGELPIAFYATVTAMLSALRGDVPLHGSAVEQNGEATLICGPAGAGKSTLTAALIAQGAQLISDDLSILRRHPETGQHVLYAGRRTLRLFDATAGYLQEAVPLREAPFEAEGKTAVAPPQVDPLQPFLLSRVILLGTSADKVDSVQKPALLAAELFRPRWMRRFPGQPQRLAALVAASRQLQVIRMTATPVTDRESFLRAAQAVSRKL